MVYRWLGLLLTGATLAGCAAADEHSSKTASATPALADGLYAGYWGRVSGDGQPNCPARRPGTLEIGDDTLSLAADDTTIFVLPLPKQGPLYAVVNKTTLNGTRGPDGGMVFTTTSPTCKMQFDVSYLPGF